MGRGARQQSDAATAADIRGALRARSRPTVAWWAGGTLDITGVADDGTFTRPTRGWENRVTPLNLHLDSEDHDAARSAVAALDHQEPGDPDTRALLTALGRYDDTEATVELDALGLQILMTALADEHQHMGDERARSVHQRLQSALGSR